MNGNWLSGLDEDGKNLLWFAAVLALVCALIIGMFLVMTVHGVPV